MTYLLILRGINGGAYHQVRMATLRNLMTMAGFTRVHSYANSGNLIFDSRLEQAACEQRISAILAASIDFPLNFGVYSAAALLRNFRQVPTWWTGTGPRQHLCLFKLANYDEATTGLREPLTPLDHVVATPHLIFWTVDAPAGFQHSAYGQLFGTPFYQQTSARSYRTTLRLVQLLQERTR